MFLLLSVVGDWPIHHRQKTILIKADLEVPIGTSKSKQSFDQVATAPRIDHIQTPRPTFEAKLAIPAQISHITHMSATVMTAIIQAWQTKTR